MRKLLLAYILLLSLVVPSVIADSSVKVESIIEETVRVNFEFTNIEQRLYDDIQMQGIFNASSIPMVVEERLEQMELKNAWVVHDPLQSIFDNETHSIKVELFLAGFDIISYRLNTMDMTKIFRVRTDWRNFEVSLTHNYSLNLNEHFGNPVSEWTLKDHTFEAESSENNLKMSFRFVLPEKAFVIHAEEDIIVFKTALGLEDTLLNSPFLILGAIIVVNVVVLVYRRVKK
jgi:hypothetical protein